MDWIQIFNLLIVMMMAASVAGFMAGLLGVGGGLVMVPALYYAFTVLDFEMATKMHLALGTSLAIIIPTSIMSTRTKTANLVLFFSIFAFLVGLFFLFLKSKLEETERNIPKIYKIIIGNFIGFISVPLGIGGGSLSVPFMRLFGYDMRKAIGTSAAIGILIAISGTISMISSGAIFATVNSPLSFGYFNLAGFLVFVPVTMLMAPLGAKVVHKVSRSLITKIFGIYLILISLRSFIEYLNIK